MKNGLWNLEIAMYFTIEAYFVCSFLKQVVQSSRKCSGSTSMDDFLGFVEFPIKVNHTKLGSVLS